MLGPVCHLDGAFIIDENLPLDEPMTDDVMGTGQRWMGVGHGEGEDGPSVVQAAITEAIEGRTAAVVILFVSLGHDLKAVAEAAATTLPPGTPLAGCTTAGELSDKGPTTSGIVAIALGGPGIEAAVAVGEGASFDQRAAGVAAASAMLGLSLPNRVLILLTPGLLIHQEEIVRGAYSVTGATVPILGGAAGDGLAMTGSFQIARGRVLQDAVVGVSLASTGPLGLAMAHGWRRVGNPMAVTRGDGARIDLLDDQPALDTYLDRLEAPEAAYHDPLALNRFALTHPLGLERMSGEDIRVPGEADYEKRAIICTAEVPPGALVWLMEGDDVSVLESATEACTNARGHLLGAPPIGAIVFDCVGRRLVLGASLAKEAEAVRLSLGGVPFGGFFTYGEIARARGSSGVHNETFVVLALA